MDPEPILVGYRKSRSAHLIEKGSQLQFETDNFGNRWAQEPIMGFWWAKIGGCPQSQIYASILEKKGEGNRERHN